MFYEDVETYKLWSTKLALSSVTTWYPDGELPVGANLDLAIRVESATLTALTRGGLHLEVPLERDVFAKMIELADTAIAAGDTGGGADTATGRFITSLELQVTRTHLKDPPGRIVFDINHCARGRDGPEPWHRLLSAIDDAAQSPSLRSQLDWFRQEFQAPQAMP